MPSGIKTVAHFRQKALKIILPDDPIRSVQKSSMGILRVNLGNFGKQRKVLKANNDLQIDNGRARCKKALRVLVEKLKKKRLERQLIPKTKNAEQTTDEPNEPAPKKNATYQRPIALSSSLLLSPVVLYTLYER